MEAKINKNREILFNSQGRILKEEIKSEIKLKDNHKDTKNENPKNRQRNNTNINSIITENNKTNNSLQELNSIRKPYNFLPNKSKLVNNNSNLSKKKLEDKKQNELKDKNNKDPIDKEKDKDKEKEKEKEKVINFKKTIPPTTIDIDLEFDLSNTNNIINATKSNEFLTEKPFELSTERYSLQNKDPSTYSISKNNEIKINFWDNSNASETKLLYDEAKHINNLVKINKSPSIKKKTEKNKILRTKTDINERNLGLKNSRFNAQKKSSKEIGKIKSTKNQNDDMISLNTIDNESFKKSTVKKLIKNNQYKALLTEITTINLNKEDLNKDKDKDKEKGNKKIKKKFKFSERRKGSLHNEPFRKLTESSENYYDLYKKAFNNKNELEQKFSFRPREKKKNHYYKYNYNRNKDVEEDNNKVLNKKVSTISFNSKQKQVLDNDNNLNEFSLPFNKNMLSNSLNEEKIYINNEDEEQDSNKNFILDLNHYIPIDEDKLISTISKPLFGEKNNKGKD